MRNLEAKFRLRDLDAAYARAEAIGFALSSTFIQCDTFFVVPSGKLKLREQQGLAWLIHYHRDHSQQLEMSNYDILPVPQPGSVRAMLAAALGTLAEVRKRRTLLLRRNIRLHLDRVDGLGDFGEIEAVLPDGEPAETYRDEVGAILAALDVDQAGLIEVSYFELMRSVREKSSSGNT